MLVAVLAACELCADHGQPVLEEEEKLGAQGHGPGQGCSRPQELARPPDALPEKSERRNVYHILRQQHQVAVSVLEEELRHHVPVSFSVRLVLHGQLLHTRCISLACSVRPQSLCLSMIRHRHRDFGCTRCRWLETTVS